MIPYNIFVDKLNGFYIINLTKKLVKKNQVRVLISLKLCYCFDNRNMKLKSRVINSIKRESQIL